MVRKLDLVSQTVTTLYGVMAPLNLDSFGGNPGTFDTPTGIAADSATGCLYVVQNTALVRRVCPNGTVVTVAGSYAEDGYVDAVGTAARFSNLGGVAVDSLSGDVFISDGGFQGNGNNCIRRLNPATGAVSTLAGTPYSSWVDSAGTLATFDEPQAIVAAASGALYVGDQQHLRVVLPNGTVSTLAGGDNPDGVMVDGAGSAALFNNIVAAALDGAGNVIVIDAIAGMNNYPPVLVRSVAPSGAVTTLAGSLNPQCIDGPGGASSTFGLSYTTQSMTSGAGLAFDASHNLLYLADAWCNTVRVVDVANGFAVSTLAGAIGVYGAADGTGSAASFNSPTGVALDASGNLLVVDSGNHVLRKVTPAGVVTTLAGRAGIPGTVNAVGTAARFNEPAGIAVDAAGNAYVSEWGGTIRMVTPSGTVTTLAGGAGQGSMGMGVGYIDATGTSALFNQPTGLVVEPGTNNVYVADTGNQIIRMVTPAGVVTTLAGTPGTYGSTDGTGTFASFSGPIGLALDTTSTPFLLYVSERDNHIIRQIDVSTGAVVLYAGTPGSGGGYNDDTVLANGPVFDMPVGLALAGSALLVADTYYGLLRSITSTAVTTAAGSSMPLALDGVGTLATFNLHRNLLTPFGLAVDPSNNNIYISEAGNNLVRRVTPSGAVSTFAGTPFGPESVTSSSNAGSQDGTGTAASFDQPSAMTLSGNALIVYDANTGAIRSIDLTTAVVTTPISSSAPISQAVGLGVDGSGALFVADGGFPKVLYVFPQGATTATAVAGGNVTANADEDGAGASVLFSALRGLTLDASGNGYLCNGQLIRRVDASTAAVTTVAGTTSSTALDQVGTLATFSSPTGIAFDDASGLLYVADTDNNLSACAASDDPLARLAITRTLPSRAFSAAWRSPQRRARRDRAHSRWRWGKRRVSGRCWHVSAIRHPV